ncbi:MAG TPA: hypothetical protein PL029_09895 [Bacteroidia bacterium]|nr:hypothetical protein [Bacteroidia bacterium]
MKSTIILLVFLAGLMASSCKKIYTCECSLTRSHTARNAQDSTYNENYDGGSKAYDKKMSEKQAKSACTHEEGSILSNYQSASAGMYAQAATFGIKPDPNDTFSASCTLK